MIHVGLIGLGDDWSDSLRPALLRARERIRCVAVFDPVARLARTVADELDARHVDGVREIADAPEVDALLVSDLAPFGLRTLNLAASAGKPTMVLGSIEAPPGELRRLAEDARETSRLLVPALGHRYSPATGRLRELTATMLGRPRRIRVGGVPFRQASQIAEVCDWCAFVLEATPLRVHARPLNGRVPERLDQCRLDVEFASRRQTIVATLEPLLPESPADVGANVSCERGSVDVERPHRLRWRKTSGDDVSEDLADERPEIDVMLDQFCRRVVGGLVPIPDFEDLGRVAGVLAAAEESLRSGTAVDLQVVAAVGRDRSE